jgi:hypothetical protein
MLELFCLITVAPFSPIHPRSRFGYKGITLTVVNIDVLVALRERERDHSPSFTCPRKFANHKNYSHRGPDDIHTTIHGGHWTPLISSLICWKILIYIKSCSHEVAKHKSGVICQFHLTVPHFSHNREDGNAIRTNGERPHAHATKPRVLPLPWNLEMRKKSPIASKNSRQKLAGGL